jgi:HEAT repeat protein
MPLIRKPAIPSPADTPADSADLLRSGATDERWSAARRLTRPQDVAVLREALSTEREPHVRETILSSLARISTPESAGAVIPYIRSEDASYRTGALDALLTMPEAVRTKLPELLGDTDSDVRLLACELVRVMPGPEPAGLLCALIDKDADANVCAAAIEVLAEIGGVDALPALARCAERFADQPFLVFSSRVAAERIGAQSAAPLG